MAIRYFCNTCNCEVNDKSLLFTLVFTEIESEAKRNINRYDIDEYSIRIQKEICFYCRVQIIKYINTTLKTKDESK